MKPRPAPRKEYVQIERLTLDLRLQMRDIRDAAGNPLFHLESHVRHLAEQKEAGAVLPPVEVVNDTSGRREVLYLIAGYHRVEVERRAGTASIPALVYPGTFTDAVRWAATSNVEHGLNRTAADCQKAFAAVFDNEQLRAEVIADAARHGGIERSFARAAGISYSIVGRYLAARGLRACRKSRALVPLEEPRPEPDPVAAVCGPPSTNGHHARPLIEPMTSEGSGPLFDLTTAPAPARVVDPAVAREEAGAAALATMLRHLDAAARAFDALMQTRSEAADIFARYARQHNAPVSKVDGPSDRQPIGDRPTVTTLFQWPQLWVARNAATEAQATLVSNSYERRAEV
jgi:hypothetical protein